MTIDTKTIRELASKSTPGPWRHWLGEIVQLTDSGKGYPLDYYPDSVDVISKDRDGDLKMSDADGEYIAAVSPSVVVAMLDEIERLTDLESRTIAILTAAKVPPADADDDGLHLDQRVRWLVQQLTDSRAASIRAHAEMDAAQADHVELNGHIDVAKECCDYLYHEAMDSGDPSGKLRDFVTSLSIVMQQCKVATSLRSLAAGIENGGGPVTAQVMREAADEIERLRSVVVHDSEQIAEWKRSHSEVCLEVMALRFKLDEMTNACGEACRLLQGVLLQSAVCKVGQ